MEVREFKTAEEFLDAYNIEAEKTAAVEKYKAALVKELRGMKENFVPVNRLLEIVDKTKAGGEPDER